MNKEQQSTWDFERESESKIWSGWINSKQEQAAPGPLRPRPARNCLREEKASGQIVELAFSLPGRSETGL